MTEKEIHRSRRYKLLLVIVAIIILLSIFTYDPPIEIYPGQYHFYYYVAYDTRRTEKEIHGRV